MNRSDFIRILARRNPDLPPEETARLANRVFADIARHLARGGRVELRGFGTFFVRNLPARRGRNPQTGEMMEILARRLPRFKAGAQLRFKVADAFDSPSRPPSPQKPPAKRAAKRTAKPAAPKPAAKKPAAKKSPPKKPAAKTAAKKTP